ncbi:MAG: hypothetical protein QOD06_1563 [Candidatus Binatota bacterium]|nr:hypothetical protein [Candidatus Binatota bacterium]
MNGAATAEAASSAAATRVRHGVVAFTLVMAAIGYLDRVSIATAAPAIRADLGLTDAQMGFVFSAFTFAYALFEVPSGWFADRYGARITLTRIVLWWSMMTALTGAATGFVSLIIVRLLFGLGEAGMFPATTRAYGRWLSDAERGRSFGLLIMVAALGGAVTQPLVVVMLRSMSWRATFPIFGSIGVVWAIAWWRWFRDDPADHPGVNAAELEAIAAVRRRRAEPAAIPWREIFTSPTLVALCLMYFFTIYGWYFYLTWLPTYLLRARGFDLQHTGWLAALPYLALAAGVFFGGWASDHLARAWGARRGRSAVGLVGLPIAAAAIAGAITTTSALASAWLLAAAAGASAFAVAPAWAVTLEIGGGNAGVVSGAMNTFGNLGGALSPIVVGESLSRWGSWEAPLASVAVCYLLAAACWLVIDPTRPIAGTPQIAG